jgi:hypothetical protein
MRLGLGGLSAPLSPEDSPHTLGARITYTLHLHTPLTQTRMFVAARGR